MNDKLKIRDARLEDAERLVEIYSYYVLNTAVSFEYKVPTVEEFKERIRKVKAKFPYLVCEKDGVIAGYVYASAYSEREAYSWTVSTSIYVDKDFRRQGIGSFLYENLEERLKQQEQPSQKQKTNILPRTAQSSMRKWAMSALLSSRKSGKSLIAGMILSGSRRSFRKR